MNANLIKLLEKTYTPSSMVNLTFRGKDISFKTNEDGSPVLLFVGKRDEGGFIKGERYTRTLIKNSFGNTLKDHWDLKGKST